MSGSGVERREPALPLVMVNSHRPSPPEVNA